MAPSRKSKPQEGKRAIKPRPASNVVLVGGKGSKRKFNKEKAVVISVPARGSWMTVKVAETTTTQEHLVKWRKGGFLEIEIKKDPIEMLNDEICRHIFSYLLEDRETETAGSKQLTSIAWVCSKAGPLHSLLRSVSREWKILCDQCLPDWLGLVDANLGANVDAFGDWVRLSRSVRWMCRHKIHLGSLSFSVTLLDIQLISDLLEGCETQEVYKVRAYANTESSREYSADLVHGRRLYDLSGGSENTTLIVVHAKAQKSLFNAIARNCPNLIELAVRVTLPRTSPEYSEYISETLFAMPTIATLKISIGYHDRSKLTDSEPARIEGQVFTKLIRHLSGLRDLEIACSRDFDNFSQCRRYHIESETLESLNATGLTKHAFVSCKCPRLRRFVCNGSVYGNGTRPLLSVEQGAQLADHLNGHRLVVPFGVFFFPNFDVPDTCEMTLEHYQHCGSHEESLYRDMTTARYETWENS